MSYIDKVQVKGTDYDIQDSKTKSMVDTYQQNSKGFRNNIISSDGNGGVFSSFRNQFKATIDSATDVTVSTGAAIKNGLYYSSINDSHIYIPLAASGKIRKDYIVVEWLVYGENKISKGTLMRLGGKEVDKESVEAPNPSYSTSVVNVDYPTNQTATVDLPLYEVNVDGTNGVKTVSPLYSKIYDINYLNNQINSLFGTFIFKQYTISGSTEEDGFVKIENIPGYMPMLSVVLGKYPKTVVIVNGPFIDTSQYEITCTCQSVDGGSVSYRILVVVMYIKNDSAIIK